METFPIPTIYDRISHHQPKVIALVCLKFDKWTEKEEQEKVTRRKLQGRADILASMLMKMGIRHRPISAASPSGRELSGTDMAVVVGEPFYQTVSVGAKIRKAGYDNPIYLEITEEEAAKPSSLRIAVKNAQRYESQELLANFVYLKKVRPSPREISFDIDPVNLPKTPTSQRLLVEGRVHEVTQTVIERNPASRQECLNHYGSSCAICGFDSETVYGESVSGIIHVHHLTPLSASEGSRAVDPINDLRPVCPNCHAVIHSRTPMFSMEEVEALLVEKP